MSSLTSPVLRISTGLGRAKVNAGIRHLSERQDAACKCAFTTVRAHAAENAATEKLFRRKGPKRQPLKRYQHGPNLRLERALELTIVGLPHADSRWRRIEFTTDGNHREDSTGVCLFEHSRQIRTRTEARGGGPVEMSRAVDHQGLAVLRQNLLLEHGSGGRFAVALVCWSGVAPEHPNSRVGRQFRVDVANGREKVRVQRRVPDAVGCGLPDAFELGSG